MTGELIHLNRRVLLEIKDNVMEEALMVLRNNLLSFNMVEGKFCSEDYIKLLKDKALPIIMLNFRKKFFFQQDNASVHASRMLQTFFNESDISVIMWPAKSPDLNITEDVWKLISDIVYDGPSFNNKSLLIYSIKEAIDQINRHGRNKIQELYDSIRPRLCKVLKTSGNLYNN